MNELIPAAPAAPVLRRPHDRDRGLRPLAATARPAIRHATHPGSRAMIRHGSPLLRRAVAVLPAMPPLARSLPAVAPRPILHRNQGQDLRRSPSVQAGIPDSSVLPAAQTASPQIQRNPKNP